MSEKKLKQTQKKSKNYAHYLYIDINNSFPVFI